MGLFSSKLLISSVIMLLASNGQSWPYMLQLMGKAPLQKRYFLTDTLPACIPLRFHLPLFPGLRPKAGSCPAVELPNEKGCSWPVCQRGCRDDYQCSKNSKCCYAGCNTFKCMKIVRHY